MITGLQAYKTTRDALRASPVVFYHKPKAERGEKTWIAVQASRGKACIQASFTSWNLVLEGFLGGLVPGFGMFGFGMFGFGMFCFGNILRFGRTRFSWLQSYRLQGRLGML
jgi:hypothetical protein